MLRRIFCLSLLMLLLFGNLAIFAQTEEDIEGFIAAGQQSYNKGDLMGAALEFENVLMIDSHNFSARTWLAQVYADLKDLEKARKFLREAAAQAPDHPRVVQLQKLLGEIEKPVKIETNDPVVHETITLLGKDTRLRKYGLVIPEEKVVGEDDEKKLLVFDDLVVKEEKPVEKELDLSIFADEESPISPALKAWESQGIAAGLDKYFELILANPNLASKSDKGLVAKGREVYVARLRVDAKDLEARYYCGMISFINGMYEDADLLLAEVKKNPGKYAPTLDQAVAVIDNWKKAEAERIAALKRAEEERIAAELAEKERLEKEKQRKDVWASLKANKEKDESSSGGSGNAEGIKLHEDGYELYKKGKLDEAIEKFEAAIAKDGNNGKYHYHLGLAWTDKGLAGDNTAFDRATEAFQKVISLIPDDKLAKDAQSMIRDIDAAKKSLGD